MSDGDVWGFGSEHDLDRTIAGIRKIESLRPVVPQKIPILSDRGVYVRNNSETDVPGGGLMAVRSSVQTTIGLVYEVGQPNTTFYRHHLVNGMTPIKPGAVGWVSLEDTRFAFDSGWASPAQGDCGGPKPGSWLLWKGYPTVCNVDGVFAYDSTNKLLLGTLSPVSALLCKATADLSVGSINSNYQIWSGTVAGGADSGFTSLPSIEIGTPFKSGDFFVATFVDGGWVAAHPSKEITVVTAESIAGGHLKYKTRVIRVPYTEAESSDIDAGSVGGGSGVPDVWKGLADEDIEPGASGDVQTEDTSIGTAGLVTCVNWSDYVKIVDGDKCFVWYDASTTTYYVRGDIPTVRWFRAQLNGVLASTDTSATVDNLTSLDGLASPTITSATNRFKQDGLDDAACLLALDYNDLDESDNPKALLVQVWCDAHRIGKADAAISAGASGTISIWTGTPLSESDSTVNVTGYNRTSVDIPSGGWVKLTRIDGHYYIEPWSC